MAKKVKTARIAQASPGKARSHLVFVSHAAYDKWIAKVLCEKLEHSDVGAEAFRDDRDIDGGDCIPQTIKTKFVSVRS